MTHFAKEFGLSDVALHKICRKHDVPNPPLGWWAKHAAGLKVKRKPLPKLKSGISDTINIAGGELRNEAASIGQIRGEARLRAPAFDPEESAGAHSFITLCNVRLRHGKTHHREM